MFSKLYSNLDDVIALLGLLCFLAGLYLWLGAAAVLMLLGALLIYTGFRINIGADNISVKGPSHEPDQATHSH